jgi:DNA-binding SARP family transcriptional activator
VPAIDRTEENIMKRRVNLLGQSSIQLDGTETKLTPLTSAVLIRLAVSEGAAVPVDELLHAVWPKTDQVRRPDRVSVQKRILELRKLLDPEHPGDKSIVLPIERGRVSSYRLLLERGEVDLYQFIDLVGQGQRAAPAEAIDLLTQALELWGDRPLTDVADRVFAAPVIQRLTDLHETARRELMRAYTEIGLLENALRIGEALTAGIPNDGELADSLNALRRQLRARLDDHVFRHKFTSPNVIVTIMPGDLFTQDDANLAIGFTDTFDTATDDDVIISSTSAQGQLLQRLYEGDHRKLDRELRSALRHVSAESVERPSAKRVGKRTRYPVGTVATLHHTGRRLFAVAYSRMGNNLVAHSSLDQLQTSLDQLWEAIYLYGQLKPVAIPLVGAGLARIHTVTHERLLTTIIESFVLASRKRFACPELRIIIQPSELKDINIPDVVRFIRERLT